jgi:hypothetical protein
MADEQTTLGFGKGNVWKEVVKHVHVRPSGAIPADQPAATSSVTLTFRQVETIIADALPPSARKHRAWWANDPKHSHAVWLEAAWETCDVAMSREHVTFMRVGSAGRAAEHSKPTLKPAASPAEPATRGPRRRIGLISCTKKKLSRHATARDMYSASDLFRKAAAYCDAHLDGWYVLSAKYGLLEPGRLLEPYDVTLKTMTRSQRKDWGVRVAQQLSQLGDVGLEAHAGSDYVRPLVEAGVVLDNPPPPLWGTLAWYGARRDDGWSHAEDA